MSTSHLEAHGEYSERKYIYIINSMSFSVSIFIYSFVCYNVSLYCYNKQIQFLSLVLLSVAISRSSQV